jgi:hypothetical protein
VDEDGIEDEDDETTRTRPRTRRGWREAEEYDEDEDEAQVQAQGPDEDKDVDLGAMTPLELTSLASRKPYQHGVTRLPTSAPAAHSRGTIRPVGDK